MNYVFFFPDELRAESLGCYGHPAVETPNFDALAAEGTLFEANYTQHPVCMASRCALITGRYPHVAGHRSLKYEVQDYEPNFFRALKEAGYTVGLYGKNHMLSPTAFEASFTEHSPVTFGHVGSKNKDGSKPPELSLFKIEPVTDWAQRQKNYQMLGDPIPDEKAETTGDAAHVAMGIDFLRRHAADDQPFFLFLPLLNPHPPYAAPESFYEKYMTAELPMKPMEWLEQKPPLYEAYRRFRESGEAEEDAFRKINAIYLAMVSYTDLLLGRVLDELKALGLEESTTVIVSSDHGDWAGDCGLVEKWPSAMDDMVTRVPLIIRKPGGAAGHRVSTPTQLIDVFPTVFELEGLPIGWDQFGVSLAAQLAGEPGDPDRVSYTEGGYDTREPHVFEGTAAYAPLMVEGTVYYPKMVMQQREPETVCRTVMRRDVRYKFVCRTDGSDELYDMLSDPEEYHNLIGLAAYRTLVAELREKTLRWLIHTSDVVPREGHE